MADDNPNAEGSQPPLQGTENSFKGAQTPPQGADSAQASDTSRPTSGPLTADELRAAMNAMEEKILKQANAIALSAAANAAPPAPPASYREAGWRLVILIPQFFSSGLFFIVLGGVLLFIANQTMGAAHAAFTFVLVTLGVAVLLYGTGTQGMGTLESSSTAAKYNVALAGGAGVLAFCVALGIILRSDDMKHAFQIEKKYVRMPLMSRDGQSLLDLYSAEFSIDGVGIPTLRQGAYLEIFVPYFAADFASDATSSKQPPDSTERKPAPDKQDNTNRCLEPYRPGAEAQAAGKSDSKFVVKTIHASFYLKNTKDTDSVLKNSLKPEAQGFYPVKLDRNDFLGRDGSYDFPRYQWFLCVDLKSQERAESDTGVAASRTLPQASDASEQAVPKAPALLPKGGNE